MRIIFILLVLVSCTKKYQTYHLIDVNDFSFEEARPPIAKKMMPKNKVSRTHCEGQVLFSSNAQKENQRYMQGMIKRMCDNSSYLLNARLTETWWTTIIYSRSCYTMEAYCPRE